MNFSQLNFGYFSLQLYGVFLSITFFITTWWFYKKVQKSEIDTDFLVHHFWRWLVSAFVFGRIGGVLLDPEVIYHYGIINAFLFFWETGIYFWTAILGFLLALFLDTKKEKTPFLIWLDYAISPFVLGLCMMDVAGFITGTVYGKETLLPWGIQYTTFGVDLVAPLHPVTLYALFFHVWVFIWLTSKGKKWQAKQGKKALTTILLLCFIDFVFQFFRGNTSFFIGILSLEQIIEIFVFLFIWAQFKSPQKKPITN